MTSYSYYTLDGKDTAFFAPDDRVEQRKVRLFERIQKAEKAGAEMVSLDQNKWEAVMRTPNK